MNNRRDLASILGLLGLSCLVQAWSLYHAVVPAPDAVRYVTVAQAIDREGLVHALRHEAEQPLFPALVWLTKTALTKVGLLATTDWATAAQIAAAIPLILAAAVVYGLTRRLVGRRAALAGGLFFCLLPEFVRLGAAGISDSVHLLWLALAVWCAVIYFTSRDSRPRNAVWILGAGVCTGVALLARAEAVLFPLVFGPAILLLPARGEVRRLSTSRFAGVAALLCGLALVLVPYLSISQALTPRSALARLLGGKGLKEALPLNLKPFDAGQTPSADTTDWHLADGRQMVFGRKDPTQSNRIQGYLPAARELLAELALASLYVIGGLALFGLWSARHSLHRPVHWFLTAFCVVYLLAMWQMAAQRGYLSGRHLLLMVVLGLGWSGVGALRLGSLAVAMMRSIAAYRSRHTPYAVAQFYLPSISSADRQAAGSNCVLATGEEEKAERQHCRSYGIRRMPATLTAWRWSVVLLAAVICLPRALQAFNSQFAAHRQAVEWLAAREEHGGAVLDSRGWTALYSGRKTYRYESARTAYRDPQLTYVIVEQAETEVQSTRGETLRELLAQAGEPVARLADPQTGSQQAVCIYRWQPQRFVQSWRGRSDAR